MLPRGHAPGNHGAVPGGSPVLFLAEDWGFSGPELTAHGVACHGVGLHVEMGYWAWKNERGFTTTLAQAGSDRVERRAELGVLYAACGLGRPVRPPAALARCTSSASASSSTPWRCARSSRTLMTATPAGPLLVARTHGQDACGRAADAGRRLNDNPEPHHQLRVITVA